MPPEAPGVEGRLSLAVPGSKEAKACEWYCAELERFSFAAQSYNIDIKWGNPLQTLGVAEGTGYVITRVNQGGGSKKITRHI